MTRSFFLVVIACVFTIESFSQKTTALDIGDTLPDRQIDVYFGDSLRTVDLASFTNKLVILDFWNTHCTSCIAAFPKMDSLQKKYGKKVQIILVAKNSRQEIEKLFSRKRIQRPDLPMVIGDSLFNAWFPHSGDPFHVWIEPGGRVYAITWDFNTNDETISAYLSGTKMKLSRRRDFGFDATGSLLSGQNDFLFPSVKSYSLLYNNLGEYTSWNLIQISQDSISKRPFKIHTINASAMQMYNVAFNRDIFGYEIDVFSLTRNNRIVLNIKNPEWLLGSVQGSKYADWLADDNQLSYELLVPLNRADDIYAVMQQDLNRYLKYTAKIEQRKMKCLALVRTSAVDKMAAKSKGNDSAYLVQHGVIKFQSMSITPSVIRQMVCSNTTLNMPVIDETNYKGKVDLVFNCELNDIPKLKKELNKYDLDLVEKEATINVLVISDKDTAQAR